jgi:hypothetical protein
MEGLAPPNRSARISFLTDVLERGADEAVQCLHAVLELEPNNEASTTSAAAQAHCDYTAIDYFHQNDRDRLRASPAALGFACFAKAAASGHERRIPSAALQHLRRALEIDPRRGAASSARPLALCGRAPSKRRRHGARTPTTLWSSRSARTLRRPGVARRSAVQRAVGSPRRPARPLAVRQHLLRVKRCDARCELELADHPPKPGPSASSRTWSLRMNEAVTGGRRACLARSSS